jgi:hypothetical protein
MILQSGDLAKTVDETRIKAIAQLCEPHTYTFPTRAAGIETTNYRIKFLFTLGYKKPRV